MSLASQVAAGFARVGAEIKTVRTEVTNGLASKVTGSGTTKITVAASPPATGPDGEIFISTA